MTSQNVEFMLKLLEEVQASESFQKSLEKLEVLDESTVSSHLRNHKCIYSSQLPSWKYSCQLFYLISSITSEIDLNSEEKSKILSVNQLNSIVHAVQECYTNSLENCVKKSQSRVVYSTTTQTDEEYQKLISSARMFREFFKIRIVSANNLFDDVKLDFIIAALAVISLKKDHDFDNISWPFQAELVFKFLLMIKGFKGLTKDFQLLVHRELMKMIRSPNGFLILCRNLLVKPDDAQVPLWQKCSMVSKITEAAMKDKNCQDFMIEEIFKTLKKSVARDEKEVTGASVYVLKDLEAKEEFRGKIHDIILDPLEKLTNPDVLLCGAILMEAGELSEFINQLHLLFSPSTIASLPSIILKSHIGVIFHIFNILPDSDDKSHLGGVIVNFLSNRDKGDLTEIVKKLKFNEFNLQLYPRIIFKNSSLQISDSNSLPDTSDSFLHLIKSSNNNFLIYEIFLSLIKILSNLKDNFLTPYDVAEDELPEILHRKFFKKLVILEPLQEMIQWKSLQSQLNEKPKEVLEVLKAALEKSDEADEQQVMIFFSIFRELLGRIRDEEEKKKMMKELRKIKEKFKIEEDLEETTSADPEKIVFDDAMALLRSKEIFNKAYGSDTLIKLVKKRDPQAISNRHMILAVALENLKEKESYAFLNIIRLLVALSYIMDTEVIDALVAEFQNLELEMDERLKIGEVIVKVTESLGGMLMKYEQQLIRCFLKGSRDADNEFRTSSLVNLGTICRLLSYKIHKFFQEMLQQLEIIIRSDPYLPSKRAATMVLSQIIAGLPNLLDFQDFLLPIYHLLKEILSNEADDRTRVHAGVALDHLNSKTKDFLNPDLKIAKEIKIRLDENPNKLQEIRFK